MRSALTWCVLAGSVLSLGSPSVSAADSTSSDEPVSWPLASDGKKVMCSYLAYGAPRHICGEGDVSRLKKRCEEKATQELGQKSKCTCTDDSGYIQDYCD